MSEIVVTQNDRGRTVDVRPGDIIVIRLTVNITTGYDWCIESGESAVVALGKSNYVEAAGMALGRGGMRVLHLVALSQGSQEVRMQLRRPWDPPDKAIEQFSITIRVL